MTSCPLLSFFALHLVSHIRRVHLTMWLPDARKVQEVAIRQLGHQAYVDRLFLEVLWRLVVDETQIGTNSYGRMFAIANDLLGQYL